MDRYILPLILRLLHQPPGSEGSRFLPWPFVIPYDNFSTNVLQNQCENGRFLLERAC